MGMFDKIKDAVTTSDEERLENAEKDAQKAVRNVIEKKVNDEEYTDEDLKELSKANKKLREAHEKLND